MEAKEDAMLGALIAVGNWALVCVLIIFSAQWSEREHEFFRHDGVGWKHLD
jgi:hypothetical protein